MTPRDQIVKRKPLNRMEFAHLAVEQGGICGCGCGRSLTFLEPRSVTDEHLRPLSMLGTNALENRSLWLTECSLKKTKDEAGILAACKRKAGETGQYARRQRRNKPLIQGRTQIQSRGFQKAAAGYSAWKRPAPNVKQVDQC